MFSLRKDSSRARVRWFARTRHAEILVSIRVADHERADARRNELRLGHLCLGRVLLDQLALREARPERLFLAARVARDQCVRGPKDGPGRAVVLLQGDDFQPRKVLLEAEHVLVRWRPSSQ